MDEAELVHQYLHQQYHALATQLHAIFDQHPALAVRMIRGEVELYEKLERAVADREEHGDPFDVDDLERLLRDDQD